MAVSKTDRPTRCALLAIMNLPLPPSLGNGRVSRRLALLLVAFGAWLPLPSWALRARPEPLEVRVEKSVKIFVGELVEREEADGWVHAVLRVEEPIFGVEKGEKVKVVWRVFNAGGLALADAPSFDLEKGARGVALLFDQHQGRYWLREDKFEPLERLERVKQLAADKKEPEEASGE